MKEIETAHDKTAQQSGDRGAEKKKQDPEKAPRFPGSREQIKSKRDQSGRDCDERDQPN